MDNINLPPCRDSEIPDVIPGRKFPLHSLWQQLQHQDLTLEFCSQFFNNQMTYPQARDWLANSGITISITSLSGFYNSLDMRRQYAALEAARRQQQPLAQSSMDLERQSRERIAELKYQLAFMSLTLPQQFELIKIQQRDELRRLALLKLRQSRALQRENLALKKELLALKQATVALQARQLALQEKQSLPDQPAALPQEDPVLNQKNCRAVVDPVYEIVGLNSRCPAPPAQLPNTSPNTALPQPSEPPPANGSPQENDSPRRSEAETGVETAVETAQPSQSKAETEVETEAKADEGEAGGSRAASAAPGSAGVPPASSRFNPQPSTLNYS